MDVLKYINQFDYISFDIFDTLIKRNVTSPPVIYLIVEKRYEKKYGVILNNFAKKRYELEKEIWESSLGEELTFHAIYDQFTEYNVEVRDRLKFLELDTELLMCQLNYNIFEYYHRIKESKKILLTSDIYLDKKNMIKLLNLNNIKLYEKLYISSELKRTKASGKIYKYIIQDIGVGPKKILHVGDDFRGDFIMPRLSGIKALKISHLYTNVKYINKREISNVFEDIAYSYINNNLLKDKDVFYQLGFENLGILLLAFSLWINKEIEGEKVEKVYFIARDGLIIKKAYDLINTESCESKYLCISRRSVGVPFLKNIKTIKEALGLIKIRKRETLESLLKRLGVKIHEKHNNIRKMVIDRERIEKDNRLQAILNSYLNEIRENAIVEYDNLIMYLKQEELNGKVAIVDLGWNGSIQDNLETIITEEGWNCQIVGYYLALTSVHRFNKKGYLNLSDVFNSNGIPFYRGIIESFFSADHGMTLHYEYKKGNYVPVFDTRCNEKITVKNIKKIQQGALDFIEQYKRLMIGLELNPEIGIDFSFAGLHKLMIQPKKKELDVLESIQFDDIIERTLLPQKSIKLIYNPFLFFREFIDSDWKIGFLKRTFLFNFPYEKILIKLFNLYTWKLKK